MDPVLSPVTLRISVPSIPLVFVALSVPSVHDKALFEPERLDVNAVGALGLVMSAPDDKVVV